LRFKEMFIEREENVSVTMRVCSRRPAGGARREAVRRARRGEFIAREVEARR